MRRVTAWALVGTALAGSGAHAQTVTGARAPFDVVTVKIDGPQMNEATGDNPFSDVRFDVSFKQGNRTWVIPGYFAGCANATETSCTGGKLWQAHFLPPVAGTYEWQIKFRRGPDVVFAEYGGARLAGDGAKGKFTVSGTQSDPIRARGIVQYRNDNYYRFSNSGEIFWKYGPDAPENMLAYDEFDATTNFKDLRKSWAPHLGDYRADDGRNYLWNNGRRGKAMLGMLRYVADQKLNTISALTWNTSGDDRNVFPHLLKVDAAAYEKLDRHAQWRQGVVQDRFDLSKLAQWERVFAYADKLGIHVNMKLQEQENDRLMDDGALGRARKLYLREMVARFGHYLATTWNLGEENSQHPGDVRQMSYYVDALDAYDRPIVTHSFIPEKERYRAYLGESSALNGMSLQSNPDLIRGEMVRWRWESNLAGKPWVLSFDEQGTARGGVGVDEEYPVGKLPTPRKVVVARELVRREIIWNALTAGGNGGEAYYGYETGCSDLNCQDHRTRANIWKDGVAATEFFRQHVGEAATDMRVFDELTNLDKEDYVFADPGRAYVVVKAKEPVAIMIPAAEARFTVDWYDMQAGGALQKGSVATFDTKPGFDDQSVRPSLPYKIGEPPAGGSGEWAALVRRAAGDEIRVEAESFASQRNDSVRRWYRVDANSGKTPGPDPDPNHLPNASGGAYVELLPDTRTTHDDKLVHEQNITEKAGTMAVLSYDVPFTAPGRYYVWTRIHATGSEDNGMHVGIDGEWPASGRRIQFCDGKNQWYWDSRQRTEGQHCGVPGGVWIDVPTAGTHRIEFGMREDGVDFDAFYLTRSPYPPRVLQTENAKAAPVKSGGGH